MSEHVGYGAEDFKQGGFTRGRLKVSTARCEIPKAENAGPQGTTVVLRGRDPNGEKQELWLTLGGDHKETTAKFKPGDGGKRIEKRKPDAAPAKGSKWGVFLASLRDKTFTIGKEVIDGVQFPMKRFAEMDLAALDGVTLDIDSRPMDLSAAIAQRIAREGKSHPLVYFATGFELPSGSGSSEADDDEDEKPAKKSESVVDKLEAFVRKALARAGGPVTEAAMQKAIATKFDEDGDLDTMIETFSLKWASGLDGIVVDKKAKTIALDE